MKRFFCIAAVFAIVVVPDWASACWFRRGASNSSYTYSPPRYYAPSYTSAPPMYGQPVVYGPPIYMQPYAAMPQPIPSSSRVQPPRLKNDTSPTAPGSPPIARPEAAPPSPDPVLPATRVEPAVPEKPDPVKPDPVKPIVDPFKAPEPQPMPKSGAGLLQVPKGMTSEPKTPPAPKTPPKLEEPSIPTFGPPTIPDTGNKLPPIQLPKDGKDGKNSESSKEKEPELKLPSIEPPGAAVPVPAPSADVLIPPANVPAPKNSSLPPLTLPPDAPVIPDKVDKPSALPTGTTESKSSPLTAATRALKVTVFPASGNAASATGLCKVGFFNHTNRDLALTIEGKAVTLPAMTYLHAHLPPTFTWKCADKPAAKETVPADATGLDVLIRE